MISFYDSPSGDAYRWLIEYAMKRSAVFVLARRWKLLLMEEGERVFTLLEPYLIEERSISEEEMDQRYDEKTSGGNGIEYSAGTYYIYRCCAEAADVLKRAAGDLFAWKHPHLPEDLSFWDGEGQDFLYNVAHEGMGGLRIDEEEAVKIAAMVPGLSLRLPEHDRFEPFWRDVLVNKPQKLEIFGFGITEIPESIGELHGLKELMVHESYVSKLPEALFDLTKLEDLTIYTADLKGIPAAIGRLTHLKNLSIACGSYHGPTDYILRRDEVSLTEVPPEIGQLKQLEHLSINYTGITELPKEMGHLHNLRSLSLSRNWLLKEPTFIKELPLLEHVDLAGNRYNSNPLDMY